jgi:hypothetical protein
VEVATKTRVEYEWASLKANQDDSATFEIELEPGERPETVQFSEDDPLIEREPQEESISVKIVSGK